jgi:hypothetical protein
MKKWLDKYKDISIAQNGIEGTMGGLTDKGFNYNGAWGGTMQMGGSMPGAVGFTYARTGGIPSNGPYAKKTKARAQNGMEMKFYQEGLDWKPRNISKQGSKIKKDDNGYWNPENWGEPVEIGSNEITMQGVYEPLLGISDTGDTQMMYPGEDYTFDGESVTEYPMMQQGGRTPTYVDNPRDPRLRAYQDSLILSNISTRVADRLSRTKSAEDFKILEKEKTDAVDSFFRLNNPKPVKTINRQLSSEKGPVMWKANVFAKPVQPVEYRKPQADQFGLTREDYITARKNKYTPTPGNRKGDGYYELKKDGKTYKVYQQSGGNSWVDVPSKPAPVKKTEQPKLQPLEPIEKIEQPKPIERKQNVYEGTPVYSPGAGTGMGGALIGFLGQQGDTTYIKPEDYERFAVPKYGKEFIESKTKKKNGGWLDRYN